eukprot:15463518-Alexandrium_andersonii.AAC.1
MPHPRPARAIVQHEPRPARTIGQRGPWGFSGRALVATSALGAGSGAEWAPRESSRAESEPTSAS